MGTRGGLIKFFVGATLLAVSSLIPGTAFLGPLALKGLVATAGLALTGAGVATLGLAQHQDNALTNTASPTAPIFVVYGQSRVGLRVVDFRLHPSDSSLFYIVGIVSVASQDGSGVHDIINVRFDDEDAISGVLDTGAFTTSGVVSKYSGFLSYASHLGTNSQTVDTEMNTVFPSDWPSTAKGAGLAYLVLRLKHDENKFPVGIPNITVTLNGQRVFDPRTSTTGISMNPALCIRDYLTSTKYGCGIPESEIDDESFEDAANFCDETVNTTAYVGTRFTFNGAVDTSLPRQQVLTQMLMSCRGDLVHQGGKYRLIIRRVQSATAFKLNEDNIVGGWEFVRGGSEVPNSITAAFVGGSIFEFQAREVTWPEAGQSNGFLTADNNIASHVRIDLPFTDNIHIAQQIAMVTLREAREDVTVAVTAKEAALILQAGDVVPLTHSTPGFTDKLFWVLALSILPDATVRLVLREYDAGAYSLDTQNTDPTVPGTDLPNPFTVASPTNFALASGVANTLTTQDGLKVPRIKASWTAALEPFLSHYEMQFKRTVDSAWIALPNVLKTETETFVTPVANGVSYDVRIRSVNTLGVASSFVTASHTVTSDATARLIRKPEVSEVVTRSGTTATLTLTIADPALGIIALEFNKREGDGALTGYVSTWDSSSGTVGVSTALSRTESVSVPDGKDSEIRWRVRWVDDAGVTRTLENTVHLANLRALTKTLRIAYAELLPDTDQGTWFLNDGYLDPNSTVNRVYHAPVVLPVGVTVTQLAARMYRNSTSDAAVAVLRRLDNAGGASSALATATHSGTGWQTATAGLSELVGSTSTYFCHVSLDSVSSATDARFMWIEITYSVPTYAASY